MSTESERRQRVQELAEGFPRYLRAYNSAPPFNRPQQLQLHVATIARRRQLASATEVLADDRFLYGLHATLKAWGIGQRASRLAPPRAFNMAIQRSSTALSALDNLRLGDPNLDPKIIGPAVWSILSEVGIVQNDAPLVSGTKALHHILPELVVPMDREYTQTFFGWGNPQFQYDQHKPFQYAFEAFHEISLRADPSQFVGGGWNSSITKVIDNALVGYVMKELSHG